MKITQFNFSDKNICIDIKAETPGEAAILTHFQSDHEAILCVGEFQTTGHSDGVDNNGLRVFIRNKIDSEFFVERENELGRRGMLERRKRRKR